jgi:transcriptional regulator with XRE-family HTH domain
MASLGQELKRERELRSVSLREISDQTKIGIRHLQAMEDDRLDLLPGKFLTKAILRSYAKALGVDEDRILNKFHEEALAQEWDSRLAERARPDRALQEEPKRRPRRALLWIVFVIVTLAVLACLYFFVLPRGGSSPTPPGESAPQPVPEEKNPAVEFPVLPPVVGANQPVPTESLRIEFEFQARTWMHIAADGVIVLEGIRDAGTRATCEAKSEVILQTGNAGGFSMIINGRPARRLGQSGKVMTDVRIRPDNLGQFLAAGK